MSSPLHVPVEYRQHMAEAFQILRCKRIEGTNPEASMEGHESVAAR